MKVKELVEQLSKMNQDAMVVVGGHDGGVDEAAVVYGTKITTGVNDKRKRWYYGEHEEDDDGKVLAVRIS